MAEWKLFFLSLSSGRHWEALPYSTWCPPALSLAKKTLVTNVFQHLFLTDHAAKLEPLAVMERRGGGSYIIPMWRG